MKKYFVKYLSVDYREDCELHKLFLCSRDIKMEDTVSWLVDGKVKSDVLSTQEWIDFAKESDCFKIIGEISPDATWVKEGDKFDENEVQIMGGNQWGELHDLGLYKKSDNVNVVCLIKGPCGHFH